MTTLVANVFNFAENDQATDLDALLTALDADKRKEVLTAVNAEGLHPLHAATIMNSPEAVKILLKHGADPRATVPRGNFQGYVALEFAMQRRYRALINILEPLTQ